MSKMYRTARGQMINVEDVLRKGEEQVAVGNMRVNGRGDEIGEGGGVVRNLSERAKAARQNKPTVANRVSMKPPVKEPKKTEEVADEVAVEEPVTEEVIDEKGDITITPKKTTRRKKTEENADEDSGTEG